MLKFHWNRNNLDKEDSPLFCLMKILQLDEEAFPSPLPDCPQGDSVVKLILLRTLMTLLMMNVSVIKHMIHAKLVLLHM